MFLTQLVLGELIFCFAGGGGEPELKEGILRSCAQEGLCGGRVGVCVENSWLLIWQKR